MLALAACTDLPAEDLDDAALDDGDAELATAAACGTTQPIASVAVSGAQVGNPGAQAIDGNLATRWSHDEIGATLTADLGAVRSVCSIAVAWYNGAARTSDYALSLSRDGTSFVEVAARTSSGTTTALEPVAITARDARYVRLTVYGNSQSNWASVTELAVTGGPRTTTTTAERDALVYGEYQPTAATVGPVAEVTLAQFGTPATSTNFVVSRDGQIVENLEIWGSVDLGTFRNVVVRNCIIHGTLARGVGTSHVFGRNNDLRGARIQDSALVGRPVTVPASYNGVPNPDAGRVNRANEWVGGLGGANFTVLRTEIRNTSDGIGLTSQLGNVTVKGSWIHDGWFNEWPASQASPSSGTAKYYPYSTGTQHYTHVDGIQFHRGKNYTIVGNRIGGKRVRGAHNATPSERDAINSGDDNYNAALMIKQEVDATAANKLEHILIDRNWLEGSAATVNITWGRNNRFETLTFSNNKFPRSTWGDQWYILRSRDDAGVPVGNFSNNVFADDGTPVPITRGN